MMMTHISDSATAVFMRQVLQMHWRVSQCHDQQRLML